MRFFYSARDSTAEQKPTVPSSTQHTLDEVEAWPRYTKSPLLYLSSHFRSLEATLLIFVLHQIVLLLKLSFMAASTPPHTQNMTSSSHDEAFMSTCEDSILQRRIDTSPHLENHRGITLLSDQFLAKSYDVDSAEDTIQAMTTAHHLGLRTPRIIRLLKSDDVVYLIVDRIPGKTLEETWPDLSWIRSVQLALQLRRWITTLRSISSPTAGGLHTGQCRSFWLDDHYKLPPGASPGDLTAYLRFWDAFISIRQELKKSPQQHLAVIQSARSTPLDVEKLVLTHHDLAPRNIILDTSGRPWLIDWDLAGFYPPYFEYAAMNNFTVPRTWGWFARLRWSLFTWTAAGFFYKQRRLLASIRHKILRYSAGRRRSVEVGATKRWRREKAESFGDSSPD